MQKKMNKKTLRVFVFVVVVVPFPTSAFSFSFAFSFLVNLRVFTITAVQNRTEQRDTERER